MSASNPLDAYETILNPTSIVLEDEEQKIGGTLENAQAASIKADIWLRIGMAAVVALIFIGLNWAVMGFIRDAFAQDVAVKATGNDRLVTTEVLMALIGATVVQTGVGIVAILSYLFPKRSGG